MKLYLLLVSTLGLALIVAARPNEDTAEETSALGPEDGDASDAPRGDTPEDTTDEGDADTSEEHDMLTSDDEVEDHGKESENGDDTADGTDEAESTDGESDGSAEDGAGGSGEGGKGGKESARNTYRQVHKLLKKVMKVDVKDKYLKSFIVARLQERLMNPTIDLVGNIEKYSKIKECFSSVEKDTKDLVKESEKAYKECSEDKSNTSCGSEGTRELDDGLIDLEQELSDCIVEKRDADSE
uniref:Salivary gland protein n=1 Tax=Anopheles albimanus TaxID=7167 RepID=Q45TQ1_ANOAL|nr:salivary gland protein [Anopheles albimanus]